jgi:hypothetical protein
MTFLPLFLLSSAKPLREDRAECSSPPTVDILSHSATEQHVGRLLIGWREEIVQAGVLGKERTDLSRMQCKLQVALSWSKVGTHGFCILKTEINQRLFRLLLFPAPLPRGRYLLAIAVTFF